MTLLRVAYILAASAIVSNALPWTSPTCQTGACQPTGYPTATGKSPASASCGYPGGGPTVTIDAGVVIGTTTSLPMATATVNKFLGVPFAKSPPERFSPPESPGTFAKPIMATKWSAACNQQFVYPKQAQEMNEQLFNNPRAVESEDCLYLNVYAPSTPAPADGRAVMYWIYGGAFAYGNAGQHDYDGSFFAAYQDVIVVTVNYRTNVFGFPSSPELPLTGHNLGFLDQRFGLDWVQRNIAVFGGSPDKVTIFGQSAGAESVDALLTSFPHGSSPPFRGAILESGQISNGVGAVANNTVPNWDRLAEALGCPGKYSSTLTCVRAASADDIIAIIDEQVLNFTPVPDNVTLVSEGAALRQAGKIASIPVLGGTNAQEGRVMALGQDNTTAYLESTLGNNTQLIAFLEAAYPLGKAGVTTQFDQIAQILTGFVFQCPQAAWANQSAAAGIPTWRYYFNSSFANTQQLPGLGVYHTSEIPLVFGTYPTNGTTAQEYALSRAMQSAWATFAKNPLSGPGWNQVGTGAPGEVLVGINTTRVGGVYTDAEGGVSTGAWDLGVFGNQGDSLGSGITVIDQSMVDSKCPLFAKLID